MKKSYFLSAVLAICLVFAIFCAIIYNSDLFISNTMDLKSGAESSTCVKYNYEGKYEDNELKLNFVLSGINNSTIEIARNIMSEDDEVIRLYLHDKKGKSLSNIKITLGDINNSNEIHHIQKSINIEKSAVRRIKTISPEYKIPICRQNSNISHNLSNSPAIIVYYSNSGNTKVIANRIKKILNCDIAEIKTENVYENKNLLELKNIVQKQIESGYIPKTNNIDIKNYKVVFVGGPVWRSHVALPVKSFLLKNNFENKIIIPFYSYGGKADKIQLNNEMKEYSKNAVIMPSLLTMWKGIGNIEYQIIQWLNETYL